ncbi:MAG TPA: Gfo/Idh/MocA family oxidoreductase [Thermoanaerobaculia bacterium]|nr:Gfo/Idh/MocA family oxidoreductase [Thermoanaerobaculia bacterium]
MSGERTRIGIVGTGYLGRLHARVLTEMPEVEVVGFVELSDDIAAEVTASLGLARIASIEELAERVDCAVVATPTTHHYDVARRVLEAGRDVLIEKPITAEAADAQRLIDLAASRGRLIQVGHVERYNPAIVAVAPLLTEIRYLEAERLGVFVPRSLDVDVLLDLMIHDLNLVLSLLGHKVSEIRAVGVPVLTDKVDITNVRLELANGAVANLTASRVSQERVRKVRFFGSDSYISVDTKEQEVKGYRLIDRGGARAIQPIDVVVHKKEPLRVELESFVASVRSRSRPLVAGEDGLAAVELAKRVADAIDQSVQQYRA